MWLGAAGAGVFEFRGGQLNRLGDAATDSLLQDPHCLLVDTKKRVWIGAGDDFLLCRDGDQWRPYRIPRHLARSYIDALAEQPDGTVWAGSGSEGLFQFKDGKLVTVNASSGLSDGWQFVVGTDVGLILLRQKNLFAFSQAEGLGYGAVEGMAFVGGHQKARLDRYGRRLPLVCRWRSVEAVSHSAPSGRSIGMAEQPDGTVWAGSGSEGLFQFKDGKLVTVNASSGLSDNSVNSLLVDRDGNLWSGTDVGLNLLRQKNLFAFSQAVEGLGYGAVEGMAEIAPDTVWVAKPGDGLYRWDGNAFSRLVSANLSVVGPQINCLMSARDGGCWVAGAAGLLHFKQPKLTADKAELFTLSGMSILSLCEDPSGSLWAGTRDGKLWRLQDKKWSAQTTLSQSRPVTVIAPGTDGGIWIGTEGNGIYHLKDGAATHVNTDNGLLSNLIRALYLDQQGVLWIGTAGGGLSRCENDHVVSFITREGLPDNTISQILEDGAGRLWLGSNRGISCVSKRDLDALAAGKISGIYPQTFGRAEGMLSEECTGGFCPAGMKTASGLLWFSTLKGAVVVDPRLHLAKSSAPLVLLEELSVDGVLNPAFHAANRAGAASSDSGHDSSSETETLGAWHPATIALNLNIPASVSMRRNKIQFRYRLEGLDSDWVEAGTRRTAFYNYVPHGRYQFRVIACNGDGVWNETGVSLALIVPPYFWQSWWFISLMVLSLTAVVGGGARIVEKRRLQRQLKTL